ncbi:MAG: radical SAM protein, partial [Candidatus Omnitrophica bacterium]|nr:radical SAM protein [Candidatus Omnitrophota bacterium]
MKNLWEQCKTIAKYQCSFLHAGIPSHVFWVITDQCNVRCQFCNFWKGIYRAEHKAVLSTSEVKNILTEMSILSIPSVVLTGGEPFLRPDIMEILDYAIEKIPYLRVQTNATLISEAAIERIVKESLLDEIWISLDGIGATHDRLRGREGVFDKVMSTLSHLKNYKQRYKRYAPHIVIHTAVSNATIDEFSSILSLCVDYRVGEWYLSHITDVTTQRIYETENVLQSNDFYSQQMRSYGKVKETGVVFPAKIRDQIAVARKKGLTVFVDPLLYGSGRNLRPRNKCLLLWANTYISPYGDILTCPMLDRYVLGNLSNASLMDIWNSEKIKRVRLLSSQKRLPICEDCCVQRTTVMRQLRHPTNFKRVFLGRGMRKFLYRCGIH